MPDLRVPLPAYLTYNFQKLANLEFFHILSYNRNITWNAVPKNPEMALVTLTAAVKSLPLTIEPASSETPLTGLNLTGGIVTFPFVVGATISSSSSMLLLTELGGAVDVLMALDPDFLLLDVVSGIVSVVVILFLWEIALVTGLVVSLSDTPLEPGINT